MKKVTIELCAEYIDWKDLVDKINETVVETAKEITSFDINYSETEE